MIVYYSAQHLLHAPRKQFWGGKATPHPEVPARAQGILEALKDSYRIAEPPPLPQETLSKVHSQAYLSFIERTCRALPEGREAFPFLFPKVDREPPDRVAQRGFYSFDTVTPLSKGTYPAAMAAASCASTAARRVGEHGDSAYCLSRPPGHHAGIATMGGYCYVNNAAVAAAELAPGEVAILDIDAHHGNGTQEIFYSDGRVLTCSIHGDPRTRYPYAWGFQDERGEGPGKGLNINVPLPDSSDGTRWIASLVRLLDSIRAFDPRYLIVSLGVDGLKEDDGGSFRLSLQDFAKAGSLIADAGFPTVIIQEGGYHLPMIGRCVRTFLDGWG